MKSVIIFIEILGFYYGKFWSIFHTFRRHTELENLITWAKRKRLHGVTDAYLTKLLQEEQQILRVQLVYPLLTCIVKSLYVIGVQILPAPRYYKGYAAKYRRSFLTRESKKSYSYYK